MIKKYGSLTNIFLIVILGIISIKFGQINNEKTKISSLYSGETSMVLSQTGLDPDTFMKVISDLGNIEGVTPTNTYMANDGEKQNTLFIDQIYYENYLKNMDIIGTSFQPSDFKIEFSRDTVVPVIISSKYAKTNSLSIGSQTTIENFLPSACELYSDENSFIVSSDGTTVQNTETNNKSLCQSDNTYGYLDDENGYARIPVKVIGIFANSGSSFPGFPSENYPAVDVIAPSFIVKNKNEELYNVPDYKSGKLTPTKSQILLFVNYDVISESELNEKIRAIEEEIGVSLALDKETDWQKFAIEDTIKMDNQALVNYLFIGLVILVLWLLQIYYRLIYFKYECAVMNLLGSPRITIITYQFKNNLLVSLIVLGVVVIVGMLLNILLYTLIFYGVLYILEYLIFGLCTFKVNDSNISELLTGGSV